jgi:hypothetical protein
MLGILELYLHVTLANTPYPGDHVSAVADRMQNHVLPFFGRSISFESRR